MRLQMRLQQWRKPQQAVPGRAPAPAPAQASPRGAFSGVRDGAAEWWRLLKAFVGWPWLPEQWISLSAFTFAVVIGVWLATINVGSGDYGQWLMVSRAYIGEGVPGYRDISTVPPVAPMLLGFTQVIVGDPVVALQVFKGLLGFGFVIAVYLAGKNIYQSRAAGLLATVFAFLVADRMLELFAFGGLPQITAMVFMVAGAGAIAKAAHNPTGSWRMWTVAALLIALSATSHAGTGVIACVVSAVMVGGVLVANRHWSWRDRFAALVPFSVVAAGLLAYYIPVLLPANEAYTSNPASQEYRGPDRIWAAFNLYVPNWAVMAVGSFFLADLIARIVQNRRLEAGYHSLFWALGAWGFLGITVMTGSGTDYPRFTAPLLVPLAVAAGGGMAIVIKPARKFLRDEYQQAAAGAIPLVAAAVLGVALGFTTTDAHSDESRFYSLPTMGAVRDIAAWLDDADSSGKTVVAPTREGKWIEGLTGRESLIDIPVRFSFRESELERSIANQTILKSTGALINEHFFLKFTESKASPYGTVPTAMWIGVNHGGEYVDLIRPPASTTRVFTGGGTTDVLATLGALDALAAVAHETPDRASLTTEWTGARRGSQVGLTRTVELTRGQSEFTVTDTASSSLASVPVSGMQLEITPLGGVTVRTIVISGNTATITFAPIGSSTPVMTVTADDSAVTFTTVENRLVATTTGDTLSLRYAVAQPGQPLHELAYLDPAALVDEFNIGYVMLEGDSSSAARAARLSAIGFGPVYAASPYTLLGTEGPFISLPGGPTGSTGQPDGGQTPVVAQPTPTATAQPGATVTPLPTATPGLPGAPGEPTVTATAQPTATPTPTASPTPVPPPSELIDAALWVNTNIGNDASLLAANTSDGDWLESLTGLRTLSLDVISAGQGADALNGALAVDTLLRSTGALANENFSLKYVDSKLAGTTEVPRQLWAAGSVDGQYTALLRLLPAEMRVMAGPGDVLATLNALDAASVEVSESEDEIRVITTWTGERRGGSVKYVRTVVLTRGANYFDVIDEVSGTAPMSFIDIDVRAPLGVTPDSITTGAGSGSFVLPAVATTRPTVTVTSDESGTKFEARESSIGVVSTSAARLQMRFTIPGAPVPIAELQALVPADLINDFNVQAVFLRRDGSFSAREKRLNILGFTTVAEFGSLALMTREAQ